MAHLPTDTSFDITAAVNALVTEEDEPVDHVFSEKQQRLLTEPLYSLWTPPPEEKQPGHLRPFWAAAHVGIFPALHQPPLVPDVFVSLDVSAADNMFEQRHLSSLGQGNRSTRVTRLTIRLVCRGWYLRSVDVW